MKRIILLIAMLCVCAGVNAQSRTDIGLRVGGSKDLGYEGAQVGATGRAVYDSSKVALIAEGSYLFRNHKYTGEGHGFNVEGGIRYYLHSSESVRLFASAGLDVRHLNAGTFTKTGTNAFTGGGVVIRNTTMEAGYGWPDTTENEAHGIRAEFEQLLPLKGKSYVSVRGKAAKVDFNNPFTNRFNLSGVQAAITVSIGRFF